MMDENVKPGDGYKRSKGFLIAMLVGKVILCIILYPFFLVFYAPVSSAYWFYKAFEQQGGCALGAIVGVPVGFVFGIFLNICFIPLILIMTLCFLVVMLIKLIKCICNGCRCASPQAGEAASETNRRNAE